MKTNHLILLFLFLVQSVIGQRSEFLLEKNWKFTREDKTEFIEPNFNDQKWQNVTVPHDWAIYGPFDGNNDMQLVAIEQDGEKNATMKAGRTGGLPFVGVGWYRNQFQVPDFKKGKRVSLLFDGAMSDAVVYINGKKVGNWPYGYNAFHFDITDFIKEGESNLLAVRLENQPESSRWYPGAGIYRNVHVIVTEDIHIPVWGTYITTPVVTEKSAMVRLRTEVVSENAKSIALETDIFDPQGKKVASLKTYKQPYDKESVQQVFNVANPQLWTPNTPSLYTAKTKLIADGVEKDTYDTRFGIRELKIIPEKGMFLNGESIKFKGVCLHHDLGPLGAAVNESVLRYRLKQLKEMGCNAIRTSHNMPDPELVNLCDEMGFMMMLESFDEWKYAKCKNGYNRFFDEWVEKDLVNLIRHYRNNPSVVMWCIGNEIPDQGQARGVSIARSLQDICHREDPTRLVTHGTDRVSSALKVGFLSTVDIPGLNYRLQYYRQTYEQSGQRLVLGCETASTISSRGVYKFPVERLSDKKHADQQCSSYDLEHCNWSNLPEDDFIQHDDYPYCIGEFVWTGYDYLGEPTPYNENWPSHSSMFGMIDLAGLPKDRYYLYRSHWNKEAETLHLLPHWTWPGREGEVTPVMVYTNYPSAELFINGISQGRVYKDTTVTEANSNSKEAREQLMRQKRYRLMWMNTVYQPGELKVVAYDKEGKAAATKLIRTAGKPNRIEASIDRNQLVANGKDIAYVTVKIVDKDGNLCPNANNKIEVKVNGKGAGFRAIANGDPTCIELFHLPKMNAFNGMLTALIQSEETAGKATVTISSKGLKPATITLTTK